MIIKNSYEYSQKSIWIDICFFLVHIQLDHSGILFLNSLLSVLQGEVD